MKIENHWLEEIRKIAGDRLIEVKIRGTMKEIGENVKSIFGSEIKRVEHISDIGKMSKYPLKTVPCVTCSTIAIREVGNLINMTKLHVWNF